MGDGDEVSHPVLQDFEGLVALLGGGLGFAFFLELAIKGPFYLVHLLLHGGELFCRDAVLA